MIISILAVVVILFLCLSADGMEVDAGSTVAGQFEDADVDH